MNYSSYNQLISDDDQYYIYNSLTNSLFNLNEELYNKFIQLRKNKRKINSEDFPIEMINNFKQAKIFVNEDKIEILNIKQNFDVKRFSGEKVFLTIAPTMECNFKCFYCFESTQTLKKQMSDDTEIEIYNYVKNIPDLKELSICWFGGEPLLAISRIHSLTKKLKGIGIRYNATLITNGYLLNSDILSKIEDLSIESIQITLDGFEKRHNKRRPHIINPDSFQVIIKNLIDLIDYLKSNNLKVIISIRVNIDKTNIEEFGSFYKHLKSILIYEALF